MPFSFHLQSKFLQSVTTGLAFFLLIAGDVLPSRSQEIYRPTGLDNVTTYHNDVLRDGVSTEEWLLSPFVVANPDFFGLQTIVPLDGDVYAQPLLMSRLIIPGKGMHNVLYTATENNSLYALDADSGQVLWHRNFGTPLTSAMVNSNDINPIIGITGTPVIDPYKRVIYVVSNSVLPNNSVTQQLHAINIATGAEIPGSPVTIQASVPGIGNGSVGGILSWDPLLNNQRSALLLYNGIIYIAYASHGDNGPYHGWILGYNENTLRQTTAFCTTPNAITTGYPIAGGAVWMAGDGPAVDAEGNMFCVTGNGTFDANNTTPPNNDYGDSVLKLSPLGGLHLTDYFAPYNQQQLNDTDADLGSGGALLLPDSMGIPGTAPHLMAVMGKQGTLYLINRDDMGQYNTTFDRVVQSIPNASQFGLWGQGAVCNNTLYFGGQGDSLRAFAYSAAPPNPYQLVQVAQSGPVFNYPGCTPSISGIELGSRLYHAVVWALDVSQYSNPAGTTTLYAFDPTTLATLRAITIPYPPTKFSVPTVADGHVYVGLAGGLAIFGNSFYY